MTDTSLVGSAVDTSTLPFDYTSRDFDSLLADMVRRMRVAVPGWDANPAAFEMIVLDQVAYVGDILNFYIDRMAAEAYIQTAVLRESVLNLAYAFGYVPTAQTAAVGAVTFKKNTADDVIVPAGTQVYANSGETQVIFETVDAITITGAIDATASANVREGVTVKEEPLGISTGAERMQFPLRYLNVIKDSIVFYVQDGGIDTATGAPALIAWTQVNRMIEADAVDRVFTVYVDENGASVIRLGDGTTGRIPTTGAVVYATYRYGKGAVGNVPTDSVKSLVTGNDMSAKITEVGNPAPMTGGADAESLQSMRINIPRSLRALDRAVTLQDYADLAIQVPGVAKAAAGAVLNTNVTLAALGFNYGTLDVSMTKRLQDFIDNRKMIGTTVTIVGATYKFIIVTGQIVVNQLYVRASVKQQVEQAIARYFSFNSVDFGFTSKLSDLFFVIASVQGVVTCQIDAHYVQGAAVALNQNITLQYFEFPRAGAITMTATGGII